MANEIQVPQEPGNEVATLTEEAGFLAMMERLAMSNIDVAKLEKMMDLHERMLSRNAKQAFSAALAELQSELPEIDQKGAIMHNGNLISKYAKFEDINEAVKPILKAHGFAMSFRIKQTDATIEVAAILSHREGYSEETSMVLPADTSGAKNAVQARGSALSYGKRYTMGALLNITSRGEDDDGQGTQFLDNDKAVEIDLLITEAKADKAKFLKFMGVDDVRHIRANEYGKAKKQLIAKKKSNQHAA